MPIRHGDGRGWVEGEESGMRLPGKIALSGRIALAALTTAAVVIGDGATVARAYPMTRRAPHFAVHRAKAPVTAECEADYGVACYQPSQIETAYNVPALWAQGNEGQGQTIAIVESYGSPTIQHDLRHFDHAFHLPNPPSLHVIQPVGAVPPFEPANEEMSAWAGETTIDVEWSHAVAPKANILLVETPEAETEGSQGFAQIVAAENYVIDHHNHRLGLVISQSFGAIEQSFPSVSSLLALRSAFENAAQHGVTVLAASGDEGVAGGDAEEEFLPYPVNSWPASDPLVTAVGGTQLHLNAAGERTVPDNVWSETLGTSTVASGGGPSQVFSRPPYQLSVNSGAGAYRATPDISMSAAVNGGVLIYTSYRTTARGEPAPNTFSLWGGTSVATPLFAGVVAIADQIAGHPLGEINPRMYLLGDSPSSGIVDITKGNNAFKDFNEEGELLFRIPGYEAVPGYDMASGLGTVNTFAFTHALAGR
jgi:subtilase family serine protease